MYCNLSDNLPWSAFLQARALLDAGASSLEFVRGDVWTCRPAGAEVGEAALLVEVEAGTVSGAADGINAVYRTGSNGLPDLRIPSTSRLDATIATACRVYLPVLIGAALAKRAGKSFVAGHVTQTLDGRIACENGQSQWIGNTADQHHSHRMRALLEGVMVGANTALHDDPALTVRHVAGANPRRIVVSGRGRVLAENRALTMMSHPGCEIFVGATQETASTDETVNVNRVASVDGQLPPASVLEALRERGVYSIYLEGGAGILSSFLQAQSLDLLQVHVASMILGAGLPSLRLPAVDHVEDGIHMHMDHAILDGHVLLTCRRRS